MRRPPFRHFKHPGIFFRNVKNDLFAALLEFVGTTFFLLFAFGGTQATSAQTFASPPTANNKVIQIFSISASFGLSLLVSAWVWFRVTGALFNPDVAMCLFFVGALGFVRFVLYVGAEIVGGIVAAAIIQALTKGPLYINTTLAPDINRTQGLFMEMFGTCGLCLVVLMLAAEKHRATPFAPIGIGLTLFAGQLWLTFYTGCAMNAARAFGPAVVSNFPDYHWIYWIGPGLGSLLASVIYALLKHYHYLRLNPGQAAENPKLSPEDPLKTLMSQGNDGTEGGGASANKPWSQGNDNGGNDTQMAGNAVAGPSRIDGSHQETTPGPDMV
ncbi:Aquaporin-1 [Leucoagaricus sp. SymC.cos]|nr:Aquaporin-1 [Leucoagaricus sp. SymC.cos]